MAVDWRVSRRRQRLPQRHQCRAEQRPYEPSLPALWADAQAYQTATGDLRPNPAIRPGAEPTEGFDATRADVWLDLMATDTRLQAGRRASPVARWLAVLAALPAPAEEHESPYIRDGAGSGKVGT